jgi:hypothetical protein
MLRRRKTEIAESKTNIKDIGLTTTKVKQMNKKNKYVLAVKREGKQNKVLDFPSIQARLDAIADIREKHPDAEFLVAEKSLVAE